MCITLLTLQLHNPYCAVVLVRLHEHHSAVRAEYSQLLALSDRQLEHRLVGSFVCVLLQERSTAERRRGEERDSGRGKMQHPSSQCCDVARWEGE